MNSSVRIRYKTVFHNNTYFLMFLDSFDEADFKKVQKIMFK